MKYFIFKSILFLLLLLFILFIDINISYQFISNPEEHSYNKYLWLILIYFVSYFYHKLITKRMVTSSETIAIFKSNIIASIILFTTLFITKESEGHSRLIILLFIILSMTIPIFVFLFKKYFLRYSFLREDILVVCDKKSMANVDSWLVKDNAFGFDIHQIIIIDGSSKEEIRESIDYAMSKREFYCAVIAIDGVLDSDILYYIDYIQERIYRVIMLPRISSMPLFNAEIISSINHKGLAFFIKNNLLNPVDRVVKKIFDYLLSISLIIITAPFLIILYIIVYISTSGNPIFKHRRIGVGGKDFNIYKFRTMYLDADIRLKELLKSNDEIRKEWEAEFKLKNDPRITKIGSFLRKTSLDELPQIINVLQGKMSLVGPRPIINDEIEKYGEYFEYFKAVKPGITGLWQVSGRNDIEYKERVQLDVWYVRNWSVGLDLSILIKTFVAVLFKKGSY
ncbi:Undecaprenyl-phosphate galactosephosphotransferase [hydrothermal vent metagenome]|uniref:Undecaprenyl-phosphate galactosephosphotransferase n=1 Tax=hydrothermal vent metagenome TaxID=652676 RepID=A0A1W1ELI0_9ZZZZ